MMAGAGSSVGGGAGGVASFTAFACRRRGHQNQATSKMTATITRINQRGKPLWADWT
jgi:hypothetical protein